MGQTECTVSFVLFLSFSSLPLSGGMEGRRLGCLTRIEHFGLGLDMNICKSPSSLPKQRLRRCLMPFGPHVPGY